MIHRQFKKLAASAAALAACAAFPASAGVILAPVSAVINAGGPGFGSINNTFDQTGLTLNYTAGVTDFDTYIASKPRHTMIFPGFEWFSNSGTTSASVTFDFGKLVNIDALALWNEESSGIGHLVLDAPSKPNFLAVDPFDEPLTQPITDYPAQVFTFAPVKTQFVTFLMSGCPQPDPASFDGCAIGEVAFREAPSIPEPGAWALMIAGFGLAGATLRRRRAFA